MKKHNLMLAALALISALAFSGTAKAVTYVSGDILLGFRATGGQGLTTNFVIDLGQASQFLLGGVNATGSAVSLGNYGSALASDYGASWFSRSDLRFAAVGGLTSTTYDPTNTLFISRNETTFGTQATAPLRNTGSTQATRLGFITTIGNGYNSATAQATVVGNTVTEDTTQSFSPGNTWQSQIPSLTSVYTTSLESTFVNGATSTALDLFELLPSTSGGAGNYIGRFTFDNSGNLSFQSQSVPEPGTYGLLLGGVLALVVVVRRRSADLV